MIPIMLEKNKTYSEADYFGHDTSGFNVEPTLVFEQLAKVYDKKITKYTSPDSDVNLEDKTGEFSIFDMIPLENDEDLAIAYNDRAAAHLEQYREVWNKGVNPLWLARPIQSDLEKAAKLSSSLSKEQISAIGTNIAYFNFLKGDFDKVQDSLENSIESHDDYVAMIKGDVHLKKGKDFQDEMNKDPMLTYVTNKDYSIAYRDTFYDSAYRLFIDVLQSFKNKEEKTASDYILAFTAASRLELLGLDATIRTDILATAQAEDMLSKFQSDNLKNIVDAENERYKPLKLVA